MRGIHYRLKNIQPPARVALQTHLELRLYCVFLTLHVGLIEPGCDKKLGKTIEGLGQMGRVDIKKIVGIRQAGVSIAGPAMLCNVFLVLRRVRVLVSTQEQHVFQKVCETTAPLRVIAAAHIDIQGRRALNGRRIRDQQHLHLVRQHQQPVLVVVIGACDRLFQTRGD